MYLKLLFLSVIIVAVIMLALGIKLIFDKDARFEAHSCALEGGPLDETGACAGCQLRDLANCPENK